MDNFLVPQAVQIGLRDLNVFMPQQAGDCVKVCPHFDLLLGEEMAASMGRNTNTAYSLSVAFDDVFNRRICQLPPMKGKKIVIVNVLQCEVIRRAVIIFHHSFSQNWGNRHNALFVVFAVDDDKILMYVFLLDAAQLPTTDTSLK